MMRHRELDEESEGLEELREELFSFTKEAIRETEIKTARKIQEDIGRLHNDNEKFIDRVMSRVDEI